MHTPPFRRQDFHYDLPPDRIAQHPPLRRGQSRLLVLDEAGACHDQQFEEVCTLLKAGDLLVFNDTRVVPARLSGQKATGGRVELLVERIHDAVRARVHLKASKAPRLGKRLLLDAGWTLEVTGRTEDCFEVMLIDPKPYQTWWTLLAQHGAVPLPPYIDRPPTPEDAERYQTVYAKTPGAVAAPTAGLHFDQALLSVLAAQGIEQAFITLHVGAGTFQPMRTEHLAEHQMHAEWLEVTPEVCAAVEKTQQRGGRIVAVGTTAVRALESAAQSGRLMPYCGDTRLFIRPGDDFRVVDALITNFHLPESTLLMLVCALGGYAPVLNAYRHAVAQGYRFFSYGDAMFLRRRNP